MNKDTGCKDPDNLPLVLDHEAPGCSETQQPRRGEPLSAEPWLWLAETWAAVVPSGVACLLLLTPMNLAGIEIASLFLASVVLVVSLHPSVLLRARQGQRHKGTLQPKESLP